MLCYTCEAGTGEKVSKQDSDSWNTYQIPYRDKVSEMCSLAYQVICSNGVISGETRELEGVSATCRCYTYVRYRHMCRSREVIFTILQQASLLKSFSGTYGLIPWS